MKTLNFKMWVMLLCVASMTIFASCEHDGNEPDDPTKGGQTEQKDPTVNNGNNGNNGEENPEPSEPKPLYELRVLTFEDNDYKGTEGENYWSSFIPTDGQYGNGNGQYSWYDEGNTELSFTPSATALFPGYGGHAISNYVGNDLSQGTYTYDLQAYNVISGANNSENFCVHFGYLDDSGMGMQNELIYFEFADGVARTIDHMYVTNTTYVYNVLENGDGWMVPTGGVTDECWFKIVAYGYNDSEATNTTEFILWENGEGVQDWTKWDLSVLGNVTRVEFNLIGSDELYASGYGLGAPGYFAYDNVAVRFDN